MTTTMMTRRADDPTIVLKELGALEIKDAEKGEVEAIIATFGVVDKDYDVILESAIPDGSKVKVSKYGHDAMYGERPAGKGHIYPEDGKAVFRGKMFLQTQDGKETFEVLKEMGKDQEWSFGFQVVGSELPDDEWKKKGARRILTKLECFEVSPVIRGAGVGTRTVGTKDEKPPEPTAEEIAATAAAEEKAAAEKKAADDAAAATTEAERKATAEREAVEQKARATAAVDDFHRVQRTLKRMRLS